MNGRSLRIVIIFAVLGLAGVACTQTPSRQPQPKQREDVIEDKPPEITVVDTEEKAIEIARRWIAKKGWTDLAERGEYSAERSKDRWEVMVIAVPHAQSEHCMLIISNKGEVIRFFPGM